VALSARNPSVFSHVYVVASVAGKRISLDPTYKSNAMGWHHPNPNRFVEATA